jgi:hypothetical protein
MSVRPWPTPPCWSWRSTASCLGDFTAPNSWLESSWTDNQQEKERRQHCSLDVRTMFSEEMVSQGIVVQFSERARDFPCLQTSHIISLAHLISYAEGKAMWNFMWTKHTTHYHRTLRFRMGLIFTFLTPSRWVMGQFLFPLLFSGRINWMSFPEECIWFVQLIKSNLRLCQKVIRADIL